LSVGCVQGFNHLHERKGPARASIDSQSYVPELQEAREERGGNPKGCRPVGDPGKGRSLPKDERKKHCLRVNPSDAADESWLATCDFPRRSPSHEFDLDNLGNKEHRENLRHRGEKVRPCRSVQLQYEGGKYRRDYDDQQCPIFKATVIYPRKSGVGILESGGPGCVV